MACLTGTSTDPYALCLHTSLHVGHKREQADSSDSQTDKQITSLVREKLKEKQVMFTQTKYFT